MTLDLSLAAHVLLLISAPLPDTLLSSLLSSSYPTLISHARRVLSTAKPTVRMLPPEQYRLNALLPYPSFRAWWNEPRAPKSEEDKRFELMRWRWIGLAVLGTIGYWFIWGPTLRFVEMGDEEGDANLAIIIGDDAMSFGADEEDDEGDETGGGDDDGKAGA
jgi:sorting and assembly machinery component 37